MTSEFTTPYCSSATLLSWSRIQAAVTVAHCGCGTGGHSKRISDVKQTEICMVTDSAAQGGRHTLWYQFEPCVVALEQRPVLYWSLFMMEKNTES